MFLVLSVFTSYGQRKIKKLDVIEKGINVKINFLPINDSFTYNNVEFRITPISGDELNSLFLEESNINGKFEYSYYNSSRSTYFLKKNRKLQVKSDFDFLSLGLEWLIENEKISEQEYEELSKQLIFYFDKEKGERLYHSDGIIHFNPYYCHVKLK